MTAATVARAYDLSDRLSRPLGSAMLLVFRLTWGWQFFQTGLGKLRNPGRVVAFFTDLGIPLPAANAVFVSALETAGGLLLLVGLASPVISFLLAAGMVVAYLTAEKAALLALFSDPAAFFAADPFFFLLASLLVLAFGPGAISLDALIRRRLPPVSPKRP
jgi:putative oxidoreductase